MYVPPGYGTMFPYLFAKAASDYLGFLEAAFGAVVAGRTEHEGQLANARVRIGDTHFMISEANEQFGPSVSAFYLYVEDADAAYARALEAGAQSILSPMDMDYGDRQGGVTDPSGNTWWISTRIVEEPYD